MAIYVVRLTLTQSGQARRDREQEQVHDQLRRLVEGVDAVRDVVADSHSDSTNFAAAQARLAVAMALRPVELPACADLLADDMPPPPYAMGDDEQWWRVNRALAELRDYSHRLVARPSTGR